MTLLLNLINKYHLKPKKGVKLELISYGVFLFAGLYCIKIMLDIGEIKLFKDKIF